MSKTKSNPGVIITFSAQWPAYVIILFVQRIERDLQIISDDNRELESIQMQLNTAGGGKIFVATKHDKWAKITRTFVTQYSRLLGSIAMNNAFTLPVFETHMQLPPAQ